MDERINEFAGQLQTVHINSVNANNNNILKCIHEKRNIGKQKLLIGF